MKQGFNKHSIEVLTSGINLDNYETETVDGDALDLLNFEFQGDELVTGTTLNTLQSGNGVIQGVLKDGLDIYYINNSNIYKNGNVIFSNNSYTLNFPAIDGNVFGIKIDGVRKIYKYNTGNETTSLTNFLTKLQSDFPTYTITRVGSLFTITKGGVAVDIEYNDRIKKIELNTWDNSSKIDIIIDGITYSGDYATYSTSNAFLGHIYTDIVTNHSSIYYVTSGINKLHIGRIDGAVINISQTNYNRYKYTAKGYVNPSINLNIKEEELTVSINGNSHSSGVHHSNFNRFYSDTVMHTYSNISLLSGVYSYNYWDNGTVLLDLLYSNITTGYTKTGISSYTQNPTIYGVTPFWAYTFDFYKNDFSQQSITQNNTFCLDLSENIGNHNVPFSVEEIIYSTSIYVSTSDLINFVTQNIGVHILEVPYYIERCIYGYILTPKHTYGTILFIEDSGTVHQIDGASLVGVPLVSTFYKSKLILGGSKGLIYYSKGVSPSHISNMYDFTTYSAGFQPVGNTGAIKGLISGQEGLYVFKENEIWLSSTEYDAEKKDEATGSLTWTFNFVLDKITNNGVYNQNCITKIGQEVFYYDGLNGVIRRLSFEKNMAQVRDMNISKRVKKLLKEIPNSDEYRGLITGAYKYPYYMLFITNSSALLNTNYSTYRNPNICIKYNVEKDSWTKEDLYTGRGVSFPYISNGDIVGVQESKIYQMIDGDDIYASGLYKSGTITLNSKVEYKKLGGFYISGEITGNKKLEIELLADGNSLIIGNSNPYKREIQGPCRIMEKIDLYETGIARINYNLDYAPGTGKISIGGIDFLWKSDESFNNYF